MHTTSYYKTIHELGEFTKWKVQILKNNVDLDNSIKHFVLSVTNVVILKNVNIHIQ